MQPHITFIGVGNMATAIIRGLLQDGYPANKITGTARTSEKRTNLQSRYGITMLEDNNDAVKLADIVVLCVKPANMQAVIDNFASNISANQLYISVAAGLDLASLKTWLGNVAVIRSMPNTPAQLGAGTTGLIADTNTSEQQKAWANRIFASVGESVWVKDEADMHTVTALSGSAPAYFFRFLEAMIKTGQAQGLDEQTCRKLACHTMLGAARMVTENQDDISTLRENITSPNGTTEQALLSLEANNIESIIEQAMLACINRSQEMAELFSAKSNS